MKENLEVEEYLTLLKTPCFNEEVHEAFILCCYSGLRWADVNQLNWTDIRDDTIKTRLIQAKTGLPVTITMHPIAKAILDKRFARKSKINNDNIFQLPTADGANKVLKAWIKTAKIKKLITWSVARLSFSILLQDKRVYTATVALLLGHRTTKYVNDTYKRHRPKNQTAIIARLPSPKRVTAVS